MQKDGEILKTLLILGMAALLLASVVLEGYTKYMHGYIIVFFVVVVAACIATARVIRLRQLFALMLFGFTIGFITQAIGTTSDLWCYKHTFVFAALSWSLGAVTMEGISKLIRLKMKPLTDNPMNVITILVIFAVIPVTLAIQDHWKYAAHRPIPKERVENPMCNTHKPGSAQNECFIYQSMPAEESEDFKSCFEPNTPFWVYYISLLGFAIITNYHASFTELLSLILAAWIMGGISEWIGAIARLWYFRTEALPPLFLVLGCWPLEFLVIRGFAVGMEESRVVETQH